MSALDLNRLNTTIRRCAATLLDASYTDGIPTETTDVWRTIAADAARDLTDMIRRLRAAEARTAWQPIETAPLDTWVWVAAKPHSGVMEGRLEAGWWVVSDGNTFAQEPTHWAHIQRPPRLPWLAPLPAAPEAP